MSLSTTTTAPETQATPTATAPAAAPTTPAQPQMSPELSAKFAALARKERHNQQLARQAKMQAEALAKREAEIAAREQAWESEFKSSPLEALKKRGYSYEELTKAALNGGKFEPETEIKQVRDEMRRMEEQRLEREKQFLESQKAEQEKLAVEAVEMTKRNIEELIEKSGEALELTKFFNAQDLVYDTMEQYWEKHKKVLSIQEAAELTEKYLESEMERTVKESKKFQKYLNKDEKKGEPAPTQSRTTSTTLSNVQNTSAMPSLVSPTTAEDRFKRAFAALG